MQPFLIWYSHLCLVYYAFELTCTIERAVSSDLTVAASFTVAFFWVEQGCIVLFDCTGYIWHAAVTELDIVSVKYLCVSVVWGEVFFDELQELAPDVGFDVGTVGWVKPDCLPFPLPLWPCIHLLWLLFLVV